MTEPHDLDELASAHLDGATSPEEAALVAGDPALQARVAELRAVREALGAPTEVDGERREQAIAAALGAYVEADEAPPVRPAAPVTPLASRRGLSPRAVRALSAAAVVVLLALLVPLLANLGEGGDDDTASSEAAGDAVEGADEAEAADGGRELAEEPDQDGASAPPLAAAPLGSYEDLDALADTLADAEAPSAFDGGGQESAASQPADRCAADAAARTTVGTALVDGRRVVVLVRTGADGERTLTVLSADTCVVLDERAL